MINCSMMYHRSMDVHMHSCKKTIYTGILSQEYILRIFTCKYICICMALFVHNSTYDHAGNRNLILITVFSILLVI